MKALVRTLIYLALIVWLGAEVFFPIVAAITFTTLRPDTHAAGTIVGHLLRILHGMGLVSGMVLLALLLLAPAFGVYRPRIALAAMVPIVLMIALTSFSQFVIIPSMERDRIAAAVPLIPPPPTIPTPTSIAFTIEAKMSKAPCFFSASFPLPSSPWPNRASLSPDPSVS